MIYNISDTHFNLLCLTAFKNTTLAAAQSRHPILLAYIYPCFFACVVGLFHVDQVRSGQV